MVRNIVARRGGKYCLGDMRADKICRVIAGEESIGQVVFVGGEGFVTGADKFPVNA